MGILRGAHGGGTLAGGEGQGKYFRAGKMLKNGKECDLRQRLL